MVISKQAWRVAKWEFMHFFKWKQEVISKLVMLGIAAVVFFWHNSEQLTQSQYQIAIIGDSELIDSAGEFNLFSSEQSQSALIELLKDGTIDGLLIKNPNLSQTGVVQYTLHAAGKMSWQQELQTILYSHYRIVVTQQLGLDQKKLAQLQQPVMLTSSYLDNAVKQESKKSTTTAIGVMVLMSMGIFVSFAQIFVSITGEKQQRVTEQLYSCMNAQTWVDGKIIGQVLLALKAMITTLLSVILGIAFMQVIIRAGSLDLSVIDWSLLPWLSIFALLGLYLSTAFMAAIAAAIDDPNHSGKTSFMMLPLIPMILAFVVMDSPSGFAMNFLSYFPLTAFAVMPVKMALVDLPVWQPLIAIGVSLLTCLYARAVAGRLFKMGMVMYGKEPNLKQMIRWAIKS